MFSQMNADNNNTKLHLAKSTSNQQYHPIITTLMSSETVQGPAEAATGSYMPSKQANQINLQPSTLNLPATTASAATPGHNQLPKITVLSTSSVIGYLFLFGGLLFARNKFGSIFKIVKDYVLEAILTK